MNSVQVPLQARESSRAPSAQLFPATFAGWAGVVAAALGILVFTGWSAHIEVFKSILPGSIAMLPLTALTFVAAGVSLSLLAHEPVPQLNARVATFAASAVLLVGSLMFTERITGLTSPVDQLLFANQLKLYSYRPVGQIATNSSATFILVGAALLLLANAPHRPRLREIVALPALTISSLALLGYLYSARPLYAIDRAAGMALPTAIAFFALSAGLLFARPRVGTVALLTGNDMPALLLRRLLLATIIVPVLTGWLWLEGTSRELFTHATGISILTVIDIGILLLVLLHVGRALHATYAAREAVLQTARGAAQRADAARAEAEAANRVKSDFLARMSHELRTPLNAIIGYSSLISEGIGGTPSETHMVQLGRIGSSARHLLSLIDGVLTISRTEAGKESVRITDVEIDKLIHDAADMAEPMLLEKGLGFRIEIVATCATIKTDGAKCVQILVNLLSNAAKFTDAGEVSLRVTEDAKMHTIEFAVSDTGCGIPEQHLDSIFDPFWQGEMNTTRRYGGTGLGLSVSRDLARLLLGDIAVKSTVGQGSTFTLSLPA